MLDIRRGGGSHEDEHPRLVSDDPKSRVLEEDCVGGQGPHWPVTPDMMMMNFEFPACYCTDAGQCVVLSLAQGSPKWCGMVMCDLNKGLLLNFLWQRRNQ
jgi:hypothetical protein